MGKIPMTLYKSAVGVFRAVPGCSRLFRPVPTCPPCSDLFSDEVLKCTNDKPGAAARKQVGTGRISLEQPGTGGHPMGAGGGGFTTRGARRRGIGAACIFFLKIYIIIILYFNLLVPAREFQLELRDRIDRDASAARASIDLNYLR
eukprot:SAG31_NODE_3562_length_4121_cov_8.149428_5_plen_146_part_00